MGMHMNGFGMVFPLLAFLALVGVPAAVIVGKAGYSRWWVILALVPMVNLLALWLFAFSRWPAIRQTDK